SPLRTTVLSSAGEVEEEAGRQRALVAALARLRRRLTPIQLGRTGTSSSFTSSGRRDDAGRLVPTSLVPSVEERRSVAKDEVGSGNISPWKNDNSLWIFQLLRLVELVVGHLLEAVVHQVVLGTGYGGGADAPEAPLLKKRKKREKEERDDGMGFYLFD
ncbi:hypothetical protein BHM03_00038205, partial [Ensete ventricosum]